MKKFRYRAKLSDGRSVSGVVEAADERQAVALLRERNLIVVHIKNADAWGSDSLFKSLANRVSLSNLANFTRQLATMINAGLNLVETLSILEGQTEGYLGKVIGEVRRNVEGGQTFAKSLGAYGSIFSRIYISLVTAGEKAGLLDKVLLRLADNLEKEREFNSKVRSAMIYPSIIFFGMIAVIVVMMIFVVPQLADLYRDFEADLPLITEILISVSNFMVNYWWLVLLSAFGSVLGWRYAMKQPNLRKKWESVLFALPVLGPLYEEILLTEITRTLSLLTGAGVPIVSALQLVADGTSNLQYEEGIRNASRMVEKGFSLSQSFGNQHVFPLILPQMLSVGEETGKVDEIMMRISQYFESESEQKVKGLTTAIEPIILIVLGAGVGFLVFAIVIPIYNLTNAL